LPEPHASRTEDGGTAESAVVARLASRRATLLERIEAACGRAGRDPAAVTLVAVTKTVPAETVRAAMAAGFETFGENRVQEAAGKIAQLRGPSAAPSGGSRGARATERSGRQERGPRWHLIGPLQSNKARRAVELFDVVETIDSLALARRLDRLVAEGGRAELPVLVEVNVDGDAAKSGYRADAIEADLPELASLARLRLEGLMTVGRLVTDPEAARRTFRSLRGLSERLRTLDARVGGALSMGMTDDFEVAVEEGATLVRLGRAIFGPRPPG
jgi:PLP dependent protein